MLWISSLHFRTTSQTKSNDFFELLSIQRISRCYESLFHLDLLLEMSLEFTSSTSWQIFGRFLIFRKCKSLWKKLLFVNKLHNSRQLLFARAFYEDLRFSNFNAQFANSVPEFLMNRKFLIKPTAEKLHESLYFIYQIGLKWSSQTATRPQLKHFWDVRVHDWLFPFFKCYTKHTRSQFRCGTHGLHYSPKQNWMLVSCYAKNSVKAKSKYASACQTNKKCRLKSPEDNS